MLPLKVKSMWTRIFLKFSPVYTEIHVYRLSSIGNWSWAQALEMQILKKGCSLALSYVWVLCSIKHSILEIRPQAAVTQSIISLHIGGNKTLALLLHRHWQKRGAVAGCCIWDGTGLFICTAFWFAGTPDLGTPEWVAQVGYSPCPAQWGEAEEKLHCFTGGLSCHYHQKEIQESGGRVTEPDSTGRHTEDSTWSGPRPLQL